ncbi:MAG: FGGY family carbohydrate kinase [Candidatus Pedobacter colombiensis]|uniref:FGGY family carbohydrate kinase n=1 Tax=Candidatus Pedobacter colombiensis TaxID=3121371 RepID=A0AAJ6B7I8_9SPHI|nr:FGGY family carbohydrate kinase [Pedobacter sp.]WEK19894.1 MAG: FGGY family carbohydrate kinase [Pedobacter sp.]
MYLLGLDIGTSSIKVSVVDVDTQKRVATTQYPEEEAEIKSLKSGWAEQSPVDWWQNAVHAILQVNATGSFNPKDIKAIGIAYQMHGLVIVDKDQNVLRDSIIWCDSRAVELGAQAFDAIGHDQCLEDMLNSPGNFTASKLAWVKNNEPEIYNQIDKAMLPGDFVAMKFTGKISTSIPALSEGIFWNFRADELSKEVMDYYGIDQKLIPDVKPLFSVHGSLKADVAALLGLQQGIPVSYKSGDQPNNALSLNVLKPGEVAATAGTSGVIYGVSNELTYDPQSRVNTFAHVTYAKGQKHTGVLLCINGTGSMYRWAKHNFAPHLSYAALNDLAATAPIGSKGLKVLPFGNGTERMLNNKYTGAQLLGIDLNLHKQAEIFRAVQEGIAFAFRYGLDIMRENGMQPKVIRAGLANLFLSDVFAQTFVDVTGVPVELYENDGSVGAALGAGIGAGIFATPEEAFTQHELIRYLEPKNSEAYEPIYTEWKNLLNKAL